MEDAAESSSHNASDQPAAPQAGGDKHNSWQPAGMLTSLQAEVYSTHD